MDAHSCSPQTTTAPTNDTAAPPPDLPAPTHRREAGLDLVRGLAVLGTFATNVWLFTHPAGLLGTLVDPLAGIDGAGELLVYGVAAGLANGKFLALLMLVFGMGVTIQFAAWNRRAQTQSTRGSWLRTYAPRALILLLDGTVNFVLVAEFDILMGYAFTGFIVAALIWGSPRSQRIGAWIAGAVHVTGLLALAALVLLDESQRIAADGSAADPAASPAHLDAATTVHATGSFLDLALFRLDNALLFRVEPVLTIALGVCLFLVGARLFDRGVFRSDGAGLRRRLLVIGAIALPFDLVLGMTGLASTILIQRYLTAPFVALGLLGLVAHVARTPAVESLPGRWTTAVGRMSLSVYVGQNLLAGALFYGWGLGLTARFPDHRVALTAAGFLVVVIAMVVCSVLWQRTAAPGAMRQGPLESLTHLALRRRSRSAHTEV